MGVRTVSIPPPLRGGCYACSVVRGGREREREREFPCHTNRTSFFDQWAAREVEVGTRALAHSINRLVRAARPRHTYVLSCSASAAAPYPGT